MYNVIVILNFDLFTKTFMTTNNANYPDSDVSLIQEWNLKSSFVQNLYTAMYRLVTQSYLWPLGYLRSSE